MNTNLSHDAKVWYDERFGTNPMHDEIDRETFATWIEKIAQDIEERDLSHLWTIYYNRNYAS